MGKLFGKMVAINTLLMSNLIYEISLSLSCFPFVCLFPAIFSLLNLHLARRFFLPLLQGTTTALVVLDEKIRCFGGSKYNETSKIVKWFRLLYIIETKQDKRQDNVRSWSQNAARWDPEAIILGFGRTPACLNHTPPHLLVHHSNPKQLTVY